MNDFTFSFNILRPSYKELDQAVFFKHDSTSCLLIVLEKSDVMFGHARMIRGQSINGRWIFSESLRYSFAEDYYNLYKENTFENISKLARYSVMTDGDYKKKGCEIDEYFWFTYLEE